MLINRAHPGVVRRTVEQAQETYEAIQREEATPAHEDDTELGREAATLVRLCALIVPARLTFGTVRLPDAAVGRNNLPMIAVRGRRSFHLSDAYIEPTPAQTSKAREGIVPFWHPINRSSLSAAQRLLKRLSDDPEPLQMVHGNSVRAAGMVALRCSHTRLRGGEFRDAPGPPKSVVHRAGRPLIVARHEPGNRTALSPPAFAYLLTQANQDLGSYAITVDHPKQKETALRRQLEATYVGALIARAMQEAGQQIDAQAEHMIQIDDVVSRHSDDDGYPITAPLLRDLYEAGFALTGAAHDGASAASGRE